MKVEQLRVGGGMGFIVGCGDVMKVKYDVMRFEMYNILTLSEAMIMHNIYLIGGSWGTRLYAKERQRDHSRTCKTLI